jgi:hypothetical protein
VSEFTPREIGEEETVEGRGNPDHSEKKKATVKGVAGNLRRGSKGS